MSRHLARFLLAAVLLAVPASASAKCAYQWFSSPQDTITENGWIILRAGGPNRDILRGLASARPTIVQNGRRTPLTVIAVHDGQMNITQALLQPTRPLVPGIDATLSLKLSTADNDAIGRSLGRLKWTVEAAPTAPTHWGARPTVDGKTRRRLGCGPATHISVHVDVSGDALGVLAEVTRADSTGLPVRWLFRRDADTGLISVGHGMCSGPVKLDKDVQYIIRPISLVKLDGTTVSAPRGTTVRTAAP